VYGDNRIICVANLDAYNRQSTQIHIPLSLIGKHEGQAYVVHDLLTGEKYTWNGSRNFVDLDPYKLPFHLFRIED
jgi:starch synthase (maltosyl-transferring)